MDDDVERAWVNGTGTGTVRERFAGDVSRTIRGAEIKRNARGDCPAYLVKQEDGADVLKSHSEVAAV